MGFSTDKHQRIHHAQLDDPPSAGFCTWLGLYIEWLVLCIGLLLSGRIFNYCCNYDSHIYNTFNPTIVGESMHHIHSFLWLIHRLFSWYQSHPGNRLLFLPPPSPSLQQNREPCPFFIILFFPSVPLQTSTSASLSTSPTRLPSPSPPYPSPPLPQEEPIPMTNVVGKETKNNRYRFHLRHSLRFCVVGKNYVGKILPTRQETVGIGTSTPMVTLRL